MKNKLLLFALAAGILFSERTSAQMLNSEGSIVFASDATSTYTDLVHSFANDLLVYPNPVPDGSTHIALDEVSPGIVFVNIIDLNGVVERTFQYAPGSYQLDVDMSNLPTGLYSVRVSGNDVGYHNLKIVKE